MWSSSPHPDGLIGEMVHGFADDLQVAFDCVLSEEPDSRGDEYARIAFGERREGAGAGTLGQVAVQVDDRASLGGQLSREPLRTMPGPSEKDAVQRSVNASVTTWRISALPAGRIPSQQLRAHYIWRG